MQTIINGGKYKVNEIIKTHDGYCAMLCTDVTVNSSEVYIANLYSGEYIKKLLPLFYKLEKNRISSYRGIYAQDGSFCAMFAYHKGTAFEEFFSSRACEYEQALKLADSLLRGALEFDLADDEIAACALTQKNAVVDAAGGVVRFNMVLYPTESASGNFRTVRLGKMLDVMFKRDRYFPEPIDEYIEKLSGGGFESCAAAYSAWKSIQSEAEKLYKEYHKEGLLKYIVRRLNKKRKR